MLSLFLVPMKATNLAVLLLALLASSAAATERLPQGFVGDWCIDPNTPEAQTTDQLWPLTIYRRGRKCETAEDSTIVRSDRLLIAGEVECKPLG